VPVTFGSDAHEPGHVGRDFDHAAGLAKAAGYNSFRLPGGRPGRRPRPRTRAAATVLRAAVIFNSSAARAGGATAEAVRDSLQARGLQVELHPTQSPGHATTLATDLAARSDVLVAVGGDGTINEVVNGLAQAGDARTDAGRARASCRLGIVRGTVNVVALELKLPFRGRIQACSASSPPQDPPSRSGASQPQALRPDDRAGIDALTIRNIDLRAKRLATELAFVGTG